jgi:hypothetical protein
MTSAERKDSSAELTRIAAERFSAGQPCNSRVFHPDCAENRQEIGGRFREEGARRSKDSKKTLARQ